MLKLLQPHWAAVIAPAFCPVLLRACASLKAPFAVFGGVSEKKAIKSRAAASGSMVASERLRR